MRNWPTSILAVRYFEILQRGELKCRIFGVAMLSLLSASSSSQEASHFADGTVFAADGGIATVYSYVKGKAVTLVDCAASAFGEDEENLYLLKYKNDNNRILPGPVLLEKVNLATGSLTVLCEVPLPFGVTILTLLGQANQSIAIDPAKGSASFVVGDTGQGKLQLATSSTHTGEVTFEDIPGSAMQLIPYSRDVTLFANNADGILFSRHSSNRKYELLLDDKLLRTIKNSVTAAAGFVRSHTFAASAEWGAGLVISTPSGTQLIKLFDAGLHRLPEAEIVDIAAEGSLAGDIMCGFGNNSTKLAVTYNIDTPVARFVALLDMKGIPKLECRAELKPSESFSGIGDRLLFSWDRSNKTLKGRSCDTTSVQQVSAPFIRREYVIFFPYK